MQTHTGKHLQTTPPVRTSIMRAIGRNYRKGICMEWRMCNTFAALKHMVDLGNHKKFGMMGAQGSREAVANGKGWRNRLGHFISESLVSSRVKL